MTILSPGWNVSRFTCCGYHRIAIPTEVEGPAVSGWNVSRFTCCGYHRIVIPTEVEGPAVSAWNVSRFTCCGYHRIVIPTEVEGPAVSLPRSSVLTQNRVPFLRDLLFPLPLLGSPPNLYPSRLELTQA